MPKKIIKFNECYPDGTPAIKEVYILTKEGFESLLTKPEQPLTQEQISESQISDDCI